MTQETDRELLEMAGKAAGYVVHEHARNGSSWAWVYPIGSLPDGDGDMPIFKWAPRTNDGDAQRLAVDLGINVVHSAAGAAVFLHRPPEILSWGCAFSYENDPYAATRRAILSAAAEIGKAMQ